MSLLPSKPDTAAADEASPRVVGVDSDRADALMSALSSGTARQLLTELHEDPAPPSELADRVDTSLQNAQYHLQNLEEAGAVEVVDAAYSEKGREMDIYAPADRPLVIFAGEEEQSRGLRQALSDLLTGVAAVALGAVVVQELFGRSILRRLVPSFGASTGGSDGGGVPPATETATATPTEVATSEDVVIAEATETAGATGTPGPAATETATPVATHTDVATEAARTGVDAAGGFGLPPGLLFFLGGLLALVVVVLLAR